MSKSDTNSGMGKDDAARIQSAEAKASGGSVEKGSFASRAQSAADTATHSTDTEGK